MGRGPKPAKSKEAKPPVTRASPKDDGARAHDLEQQLAKARAQQAATAGVFGGVGGGAPPRRRMSSRCSTRLWRVPSACSEDTRAPWLGSPTARSRSSRSR